MKLYITMKLYQSLGVFLITTTLVGAIYFQDCGSKKAKVDAVSMPECHSDPCILHPGHTYGITITFTPYEDTARTTADAILHIFGSFKHYREENACLFVKCPVKKGEQQSLNIRMHVKPEFPDKYDIQWTLFDENRNTLFCVQMFLMKKNERNTLQPNFQSDDSLSFLDILKTEYESFLDILKTEYELVQIQNILGYNATTY